MRVPAEPQWPPIWRIRTNSTASRRSSKGGSATETAMPASPMALCTGRRIQIVRSASIRLAQLFRDTMWTASFPMSSDSAVSSLGLRPNKGMSTNPCRGHYCRPSSCTVRDTMSGTGKIEPCCAPGAGSTTLQTTLQRATTPGNPSSSTRFMMSTSRCLTSHSPGKMSPAPAGLTPDCILLRAPLLRSQIPRRRTPLLNIIRATIPKKWCLAKVFPEPGVRSRPTHRGIPRYQTMPRPIRTPNKLWRLRIAVFRMFAWRASS